MSKTLIAALVTVFTAAASAEEADMWVGLDAGVGSSDYESSSDNIDTSWTGSINMGKDITTNWQLVASVHTGSGTSVPRDEIGSATEIEEELNYNAISFSARRLFRLSKKHSLYASAGLNYNQTDVELGPVKTIDESGVGYTIQGGWLYNFNNQYTLSLGFQRLGLSDVDVNTANVGFIYRF